MRTSSEDTSPEADRLMIELLRRATPKPAGYERGGCVCDRQWSDVLGILKVRGADLDFDSLRSAAAASSGSHLLERALSDAGLAPGA